MNFERVDEIAEAILYEGYMLFPYRASSVKNRQRFNFGVLYPQSWCELQGDSDSQSVQMECLLRATPEMRLTIRVRFLQIVQRLIRSCEESGSGKFVERMVVGDRVWQSCDEAEERTFTFDEMHLQALEEPRALVFRQHAGEKSEFIFDADGSRVGEVVRRWQAVSGALRICAQPCRDAAIKLKVAVENRTDFEFDSRGPAARESALLNSMISVHLIGGVEEGEFISLLEPPSGLEELARSCENRGLWPVLAGEGASMMLASPIILYDYPRVANESAGNLFDATEIDEILSLRLLTLTDDEKAEIRQSDDRVRELLERTECMPNEQFMKLHGALRGVHAVTENPL